MDLERAQRLQSTTMTAVGRAWLAAVGHIRDENDIGAISARLHGHPADVLAGVDRAALAYAAGELAAYNAAAVANGKAIHAQLTAKVRKDVAGYDAGEPTAVRIAQQNRLEAIREVTEDTRAMVRSVLAEGAGGRLSPDQMARRIRDGIGLTDYQERIIANYRRQLESGQFTAALERELSHGSSDKTIAAALRANRPLTQAQIDTAVERYTANWRAFRAESIARTEGLRIAHQAQRAAYQQAIDNGDLDSDQLEGKWNHASHVRGARSRKPGRGKGSGDRPFHVVMDGQLRGWGEPFESGIGGRLLYPGDPSASAEEAMFCACVVTWRISPRPGSAQVAREVEIEDPDEAEALAADVEDDEALVAEDAGETEGDGDAEPDMSDADLENAHLALDEEQQRIDERRSRLPTRR